MCIVYSRLFFSKRKPENLSGLLEKRALLLRVLLCLETVQAENRATTLFDWAWLEWNLACVAALGTRCWEHLALGEALLLALFAALFAALWSSETALLVEGLLTLCEGERIVAIPTS